MLSTCASCHFHLLVAGATRHGIRLLWTADPELASRYHNSEISCVSRGQITLSYQQTIDRAEIHKKNFVEAD